MRVRCVRSYPTDDDLIHLGTSFLREQRFAVTPEADYLVLGLSFVEDGVMGRGVLLHIEDDNAQPAHAPICLFDVIDDRPSMYWRFSEGPDGWSFWAEKMLDPFFYDDYYNGRPDVINAYDETVELLSKEFENG